MLAGSASTGQWPTREWTLLPLLSWGDGRHAFPLEGVWTLI